MTDDQIVIKYEESFTNNNNNLNNEGSSSQSERSPSSPLGLSELESSTTLGNIAQNVNPNDKMAIYQHPLFPLLRLLFEKCESATKSIDNADSLCFEAEMKAYITEMAKVNKPFFTDNVEVDTLMLKSLQVLAIHLLELGKVNELCKDFCTRYISCLKGKLNSENIMRTLDIQNTPPGSPTSPKNPTQPMSDVTMVGSTIDASILAPPKTPTAVPVNGRSSSTSSLENNNTTLKEDFSIHRSMSVDTPSFIGAAGLATPMSPEQLTGFLTKKNKGGKRGTLPKVATNVLKAWLFQHLVHPYPSEEEKKQLAVQTNLSILQVNNWFINARRRIIQPMLDSSSTVLKNNKKPKQPRNAAQKGWASTMEELSTTNRPGPLSPPAQQPVRYMMSPVTSSAPGPVLLNLGAQSTNQPSTTQSMLMSPVQFVQVNQIPSMQSIQAATGYLPPHTASTQTSFPSTTNANSVETSSKDT
eukprot:TCONS_00052864-protein